MNCELRIAPLHIGAGCRLRRSRGGGAGGTLPTHSSLGQDVSSTGKEETVVTSKMNELSGDVIENKGPGSATAERSCNVIENKGSYESKAGILLKRKVVSCR